MRRLVDTIRGRKQRRRDQEIERPPPPLPLLPSQRPRPITPTATAAATTADSLVAALGTLARLSPELRRRILIAAFGERTLHLDLRLAPRGQRVNTSKYRSPAYEHGRGAAPLTWSRVVVPQDVPGEATTTAKSAGSKTKPETEADWEWEWRWYGCVCHRVLPRGSAIERRAFTARGKSPYIWPHRDACLQGEAETCRMWPPGTGTCDCAIGALGWLRTCRRAYVEGAEVLYATNTFILESRDMLDALSSPDGGRRLLLPQRLAMMRSLELRWEVMLFGDPYLPPMSRRSDKERMRLVPDFAGLLVPFPNLRSLVISFSEHLYNDASARPAARLPEIDRLLLRPLALALAPIAPRQEKHVVVELPSNVFRDLRGLGLEEEQRGDEWGHGKGSWLRYAIDESSYYYIKQGQESSLYWDHDGNARSASDYLSRTGPGYANAM
ncbi:hypothetical protein CT0861_01762 [Colletotrichum tofieldiae]|uniref:DUF7730 domain-containing protein n=1 Tax=Colletotrichum tofieldiae TaxID=708197 RepID=A0A161VSG9_9PEZI|nr:hypothetical protein CT0861_01762 [Colletotrichum tofieldiae]GKT96996.1 hypothetical protein Ct61P_14846 [Colletotrichum tofieldiae]